MKNSISVSISNRFPLMIKFFSQINFRPHLSKNEYIFSFVAISGLFIFLFAPALIAKFYIVEDHLLLTGDCFSRIIGDAKFFQRVRPVYWLYIAAGGRIFGTNPHLWHAAAIFWGILSCFLYYIAVRKIGADMASAYIFLLLLVLSGNQGWIWLNLIPQETLGVLLSAIAIWAIINASRSGKVGRWDIIALSAGALSGLVKESFIILIPAMLLLRATCQKHFNFQTWREALLVLRTPLLTGVLIFLVELAIILVVMQLNIAGYSANASGLSLASFNPKRWLRLAESFGLNRYLLLVSGIWIGALLYGKINRGCLLAGAMIIAMWMLPQFVLYTTGMQERYLFPAVIGIAAVIAFSLSILLSLKYLWPLGVVGTVLLLPVFLNGIKSTTTTVGTFSAETRSVNRMVEFVAQNISSEKVILMAGDAGTPYGFEATHSLPIYLRLAGSNSPFYLFPIVSKGERSAIHIAASGNNTAFRYPDTLSPNDVGAIVIVDKWIPSFSSTPLVQWLGDSMWQEIEFIESYYSFSIPRFKFQKAGDVNHRILLRDDRSVPRKRPLIEVDHSLACIVHVRPFLDLPPWGLEPDYAGSGSIVWIGQGDEEGLGGVLSSTGEQLVKIDLEVMPGPSRPDSTRTVELSIDNRAGQQTQRTVFEGMHWKFDVKLQSGVNHFRIKVLDKATVLTQSNGDTRRLLALLRQVTIREPLKNQQSASQ